MCDCSPSGHALCRHNASTQDLDILRLVYGDICKIEKHLFHDHPRHDFDCELVDELNEQWGDLLNEDSLFQLAIENLSLSQLEASTCVDVSQDLPD